MISSVREDASFCRRGEVDMHNLIESLDKQS